jgi:hypothetical protein
VCVSSFGSQYLDTGSRWRRRSPSRSSAGAPRRAPSPSDARVARGGMLWIRAWPETDIEDAIRVDAGRRKRRLRWAPQPSRHDRERPLHAAKARGSATMGGPSRNPRRDPSRLPQSVIPCAAVYVGFIHRAIVICGQRLMLSHPPDKGEMIFHCGIRYVTVMPTTFSTACRGLEDVSSRLLLAVRDIGKGDKDSAYPGQEARPGWGRRLRAAVVVIAALCASDSRGKERGERQQRSDRTQRHAVLELRGDVSTSRSSSSP